MLAGYTYPSCHIRQIADLVTCDSAFEANVAAKHCQDRTDGDVDATVGESFSLKGQSKAACHGEP